MKVAEMLLNRYICFRNSPYPSNYWYENAIGYTADLFEAGIYTKEFVEGNNLRIFTYDEIVKEEHLSYSHYAMTLKDALKLAKKRCFG